MPPRKRQKMNPKIDTEASSEMDTPTTSKQENMRASPISRSVSVRAKIDRCRSRNVMSTLGDFMQLPIEIFEFVLDCLSMKDIGMMSMASKIIRGHVFNYIMSSSRKRKLFPKDFHNLDHSDCMLKQFSSLGLLLKRCTLLLPTKDRLRHIHQLFSEIPCFQFYGCLDCSHCFALKCYGMFIQALTAGWDDSKCNEVYDFLFDVNNLSSRIQRVIDNKPGRFSKLELRLRIFCHSVLLNHWIHKDDSVFWLTCILKPWPIGSQARLLFLLFGPVSRLNGYIDWRDMIQSPADKYSLKQMAHAVKLLRKKNEWTASDIVNLIHEIAVIPREWHLENCARFLIMCGKSICFSFMAAKAAEGRTNELARLVIFQSLVCEKDFYHMNWPVKIIYEVCNAFHTSSEKNHFLQSIENYFAEFIMDSLQLVIIRDLEEDDNSYSQLFHLINAQTNFHKQILYLAMDI
ncbi:F-box only protein 47 isoform X1 [Erythrolamprus reginae]|uniref:F-box only protein 47 isoform X1 n=1 Tax=Erythrolamprus reginae TaxID=121349 RepID=UPI00396CD311